MKEEKYLPGTYFNLFFLFLRTKEHKFITVKWPFYPKYILQDVWQNYKVIIEGYIAFPRNYKNKICAGKQRLPWLRNSGRNEFSMVKSWNTKRFKLVCLHHQQTWNIKHIQMNLQNVFCDIIILINILKTVLNKYYAERVQDSNFFFLQKQCKYKLF